MGYLIKILDLIGSMNSDTVAKWIKIGKKHPVWLAQYTAERLGLSRMDDELFLRFIYELIFEKPLCLDNPRLYTEKLQWLKLHDRNPEYTRMVDKEEVKRYVSEIIGYTHVIPTIGVWDNFDEIDFSTLPQQFVLKCTHDSGGNVIVKNKDEIDMLATRIKIEDCLKRNYYYQGREWQYKEIKPRIIAEKYIGNDKGDGLPIDDYKVLCFEGCVKLIELHRNRYTGDHTQDFYDAEWNKTNIQQVGEKNSEDIVQRPKHFEEMIELSERLSCNMHHLRVDWYESREKLLFGELTLYDSSGLCRFSDDIWDEILGSWIVL